MGDKTETCDDCGAQFGDAIPNSDPGGLESHTANFHPAEPKPKRGTKKATEPAPAAAAAAKTKGK